MPSPSAKRRRRRSNVGYCLSTVEKYHPNEWPLLNAYTARWYQTPGSSDYYGVVAPEERDAYYVD
jgi:hypothetical protein